ncbi:hypothetical protein DPMN_119609 [Dreissena polymorpha]|uniref:Uncharacterized protein n=1 Tax=Dreissena polymorpha TaxID=45954 RepID=A0A9D4GJJ7_DREPO|nr:hypothetical protein DPMN_119609 [Dreissena polymorpha]
MSLQYLKKVILKKTDTTPSGYRRSGLDDPDVCVTVSEIVRQDGEDILTKANDIIKALEKILVLRNKSLLKEKAPYKNVYIKSSKSHAERLIELNARTLLSQLPQGSNFRVDANGRIRPRQNTDRQDQQQRQPETEPRHQPQDQQ